MVTNMQEYYDLLYRIQDQNKPSLAVLIPSTETIYDVDLSTRTIKGPASLGVEADHRSEIIYFKLNRYYDHMDLINTTCLIQYENAEGKSGLYVVPFYDADTFIDEDKLLIPWCISGRVAAAAGKVKYSIRFYSIDSSKSELIYNLSTIETTTEIKQSLVVDINLDEEGDNDRVQRILDTKEYTVTEQLIARIDQINKQMDIFWQDAY